LFHPEYPRRKIIVTVHTAPVKKGALAEILETAELSIREFAELL
jgi:hypothetical protein